MSSWLLASSGLIILLLAGDSLVKGAVNLSIRFGVPALIVSLTIVAFGTSAPELLIAVNAILDDAPGLALGNVVGSNIANIMLVLGVPALISTLPPSTSDSRKTYVFMLIATCLFIGLAFRGYFDILSGVILLLALVYVLVDALRDARSHNKVKNNQRLTSGTLEIDTNMSARQLIAALVFGLVGLPIGASLLVDNARVIAADYGVSDTIIGLTLVAVGTSLPELATTMMAAIRRHADVALGNIIGSNMFNLLAIIGIAVFFGNIPVDPEFLRLDLWVMLAVSLALIPFVFWRQTVSRMWGLVLTTTYVGYFVVILS